MQDFIKILHRYTFFIINKNSTISHCSTLNNENENDNSSESGSEATSSVDSSSDEGSKNEPVSESLTTWSLSSFVKPDPKPIEKSHVVPLDKMDMAEEASNSLNKKESKSIPFQSPKCLTNEQNKKEPSGE